MMCGEHLEQLSKPYILMMPIYWYLSLLSQLPQSRYVSFQFLQDATRPSLNHMVKHEGLVRMLLLKDPVALERMRDGCAKPRQSDLRDLILMVTLLFACWCPFMLEF